MVRLGKREPGIGSSSARAGPESDKNGTSSDSGPSDRRVLRSRYHAVKTLISGKRDGISRADSDNFSSIFNEVESLHHLVQKPREQVVDAEALLDITNTLVTSVKAHGDGVSPSDFVSFILRDFVQQDAVLSITEDARNSVMWKDIGVAVSHLFMRGAACCTMLGPMNTELKQRKVAVHKKHARPTEKAHPEELDGATTEEKMETDKNMSTMFDILKKNRRVKVENIVLNRNSFSQTVENLFALSFLVKDGRAEITVDTEGCQIVSPRNAPAATAVASGEVSYHHFVFRFDFKDWKLMRESSRAGEELMPHRNQEAIPSTSQEEPQKAGEQTTPIRKLSRNRGLIIQERAVVEDSSESEDTTARAVAMRKGKRKVSQILIISISLWEKIIVLENGGLIL